MMERLESFDSSDLMEFIAPPKIKIIGVGGAGNNTLSRLYSRKIKGVETFALNTDAMHLNNSQADFKTVLGAKITQGRGAGGDPYLGRRCAEEDEDILRTMVDGADMVFVIAGMGGGTGTGAAPVVAQYARETEALVVGVAVLPFGTEGINRRKSAIRGLLELKNNSHCVIELDNEKLNDVTKGKYPMGQAFRVMDDLITETVQSLSEIVTEPSTINVDFADLRKIIETGGNAKVLYGESESSEPGDILDAILCNPILSPLIGSDYKGAEAVLLHIATGNELTMNNCSEVVSALEYELSDDVNLIWGLRIDDSMGSSVKVVMLVASIPESESELEDIKDSLSSLGDSVQMIN